eukprot:2330209-Prymnesium_polylepis.1
MLASSRWRRISIRAARVSTSAFWQPDSEQHAKARAALMFEARVCGRLTGAKTSNSSVGVAPGASLVVGTSILRLVGSTSAAQLRRTALDGHTRAAG